MFEDEFDNAQVTSGQGTSYTAGVSVYLGRLGAILQKQLYERMKLSFC